MLAYKGHIVDFAFINHWVDTHPIDEECLDLFVYLFANKDSIDDDAILGILLFIEQHDWELKPLREKLKDPVFITSKKQKKRQPASSILWA